MFSNENSVVNIKRKRHHLAHGFSLLEIMAVVVIMGLLVGAVAVGVRGYIGKARQTRVKQDIKAIENALESYYGFKGNYPSEEEGIDALVGRDNELTKLPSDPWGNEYAYEILEDDADSPYLITCYGSDGGEGGTGAAADVTNLSIDEEE